MLSISSNQPQSPAFKAKLSADFSQEVRIKNQMVRTWYANEYHLGRFQNMRPTKVFSELQTAFEKITADLPGELRITRSEKSKQDSKLRFFGGEYTDSKGTVYEIPQTILQDKFLPHTQDKNTFDSSVKALVEFIADAVGRSSAGYGPENKAQALFLKLSGK